MESDLDLSVERNYNLKTGVTEEFFDLDIDEYSDAWFNKDLNLNTLFGGKLIEEKDHSICTSIVS
ncbi:7180_t:CDS:2 [Dentiscutata erythropus]|uniref:7180_t:CDS:1 n=1 Tax=Dentiscutata erythropus TaxID=1348616 RepID=A0A9N8VC66_9GLOM|nr:7180_t:CDS:2 [Dentiscutata erythropus]